MYSLQLTIACAVIVGVLAINDGIIHFRPRQVVAFNEHRNGGAITIGSGRNQPDLNPVGSPSDPRPVFLPLFNNRRQPSSSVVFPGREVVPPRPVANRPGNAAISFGNRPVNSGALNFGGSPSNAGISFSGQPVGSNSDKPNVIITEDDRRAPIVFGNPSLPTNPAFSGKIPDTNSAINSNRREQFPDNKPIVTNAPIDFGGNANTVAIESLVPAINELDTFGPGTFASLDSGETTTSEFSSPDATIIETEITESPCLLEERSIMFNGVCQALLETGPCSDNEWAVLSDDGVPECRDRLCPWGTLFFKDSCVDPNDLSICPRGQILYVDLQGNADCDCQDKYVYHPESGNCYTQHEQGICEDSFFMEFDNDLSVRCVENPCESDDFVFHEETCYKKNYVGYCEPHLVDVRSGVGADCVFIELFSIFQAPTLRACPRGSRRDHLQRCRAVFRVPTQRTLSSQSGECKFGFKKDQNGTCRRVFELFGES